MRLLIALLLLMTPTAATAGLRATYAVRHGPPVTVEIADNGDISAGLGSGRRLIVQGGEEYLVVDRLTGPLVMRLADLRVVTSEMPRENAAVSFSSSPGPLPAFVERGTVEVDGRTGRAFYIDVPGERPENLLIAVLSSDPTLAPLSRAMSRMMAAELASSSRGEPNPGEDRGFSMIERLLEQGAPLRLDPWSLRTVQHLPIPPERIVLPAPPETREQMRIRMTAERAEQEGGGSRDTMIAHAAFAHGRLWMITDDGALTSLAEGETRRTAHDAGGPVLALCRTGDTLLALTGRADAGSRWTLRRLEAGTWRPLREVERSRDAFVAMACGEAGEMILTSRRLIDLAPGGRGLPIRAALVPPEVRAILHVTPDAAYVGLNSGEWGGGLRRIDRRTGAVRTVERNATGDLCDGPLNTNCDPVNGLATLPWRRECLAAAIGLIHMAAHGRIVSVCGDEVEQVFVGLADVDPENAREMAEATNGGQGSAAFFGLVPAGDGLIAADHNGLYRITGANTGTHHPWPRFVEVDGILVSFALPDVVLVMSELNRRASMSGLAPILVPR